MTRRDPRAHALALAAVLTLALSGCAGARGPTAASPTPRPSAPPCDREAEDAWGLFATVTDPNGAPIEGAVVELRSGDFFGNARTMAEGEFRATCVWGIFEVSVAHLDYNPARRTIAVDPGERREVSFELEPLEP